MDGSTPIIIRALADRGRNALSKTGTGERFGPPSRAWSCSNCLGVMAITQVFQRSTLDSMFDLRGGGRVPVLDKND
jgi:hypothetical protein